MLGMKNKCCVNVKVYFEIVRVCVHVDQPYPPFPLTHSDQSPETAGNAYTPLGHSSTTSRQDSSVYSQMETDNVRSMGFAGSARVPDRFSNHISAVQEGFPVSGR